MITLGITMGDPLGIGAEVIQKALPKFRDRAHFKVFGDPKLLPQLKDSEIIPVSIPKESANYSPASAGRASVSFLDAAMEAWRRREIHGLVTAPISKAHVKLAGFPFPGHTEYLADKTATKKFAMLMAGPVLRVTLVTIHEPLQKVSSLLNQQRIIDTLEITHRGLKEKFRIAQPRIAVCGLNPHAGEEGHLGGEEISIIAPAIEEARRQGYSCEGPKVPDAVFHEALDVLFSNATDAILVVKWKELYDKIEDAIDQCEDVGNVLQSISIKNA